MMNMLSTGLSAVEVASFPNHSVSNVWQWAIMLTTVQRHLLLVTPIFVPAMQPQKPPLVSGKPSLVKNILPTTMTHMETDAQLPTVNLPTNAKDAMGPTQSQLAPALLRNFNPLPTFAPTPLNIENIEKQLVSFPDKEFANNLVHSLKYVFVIGYNGPEFRPHVNRGLKRP